MCWLAANMITEYLNQKGSGEACLAKYEGEVGIAIKLRQNLSDKWQAGEIILLWPNGDITAPDGCELVKVDAWDLMAKAANSDIRRAQTDSQQPES